MTKQVLDVLIDFASVQENNLNAHPDASQHLRADWTHVFAGPAPEQRHQLARRLTKRLNGCVARLSGSPCSRSVWLLDRPVLPAKHSNATTDEVIAVAEALRSTEQGMYITHMRNEADRVLLSIEETLNIGRSSGGTTVVISHHKCTMPENFGRIRGKSSPTIDRWQP